MKSLSVYDPALCCSTGVCGAFVDNATVRDLLQKESEAVLPLVMVGGEVKSSKTYPGREELAEWLDIKVTKEKGQESASEGCCGPKGCC